MTTDKALCLNMIVKNEMANLQRCLAATASHIACWVIGDTGSTDGTPEFIKSFFADRGIPGELHAFPFINFEQARNTALELAYATTLSFDYLLLQDADMELVVEDQEFRRKLVAPSYTLLQRSGISYWNTRLAHRGSGARYRGVTHEYLEVSGEGQQLHGVWFKDHASGSNRVDKSERDIRLLREALESEPENLRYWFYLAQSLKDAGRPAEAAKAYAKRAEMGGWDEEAWYARLQEARCLLSASDEGGFLRQSLAAYDQRPHRAEPLYDLAHFYRERGMNEASVLFSEPGLTIPLPQQDTLFLEDFVYTAGLREEYSISANYSRDPVRKDRGFSACNWLALNRTIPDHTRNLALSNLHFYVESAPKIMPSFSPSRIATTPPDGYRLTNPSVFCQGDEILLVQRAVNYTIDHSAPEGELRRYDTSGGGPIRSRNFLLRLDDSLSVRSSQEILPPTDMPPPLWHIAQGFEDLRAFVWRDALWCVACVRELTVEGWCEQVLARIGERSPDACQLTDWSVLRPEGPQLHEKNWMPCVDGEALRFLYLCDPTRVLDEEARKIAETVPPIHAPQFRGGSQLVSFDGGWLALVHEAMVRDQQRHYWHRFVWFDSTFRLRRLSRPFYFQQRGVEFAAGLACHPDGKRLILSYGVEDGEAWIAVVSIDDVRRTLFDAEDVPSGELRSGGETAPDRMLVRATQFTVVEPSPGAEAKQAIAGGVVDGLLARSPESAPSTERPGSQIGETSASCGAICEPTASELDREKISGLVISYNRADIIETCLRSLCFVDELIVVDKSSDDGTTEIARRFADKVVVIPWSPVAEDNRADSLALCSHDLIVCLDDDECLSPDAAAFVLKEAATPSADVYRLPVRSYIFGRFDERRADWPDYKDKIFRRGAVEFTAVVHDGPRIKSPNVRVIPADSPIFIYHFSVPTISTWIEKTNRYTSQRKRVGWVDSLPLSLDLPQQSLNHWLSKGHTSDEYLQVYVLSRMVYDIVDKLKAWESAVRINYDAELGRLRLDLNNKYADFAKKLGRTPIDVSAPILERNLALTSSVASRPRFSLVICSRNGSSQLAEMLGELDLDDLTQNAVEISLIEGVPSDETRQAMLKFKEGAPLRVNVGKTDCSSLALARNLGIKLSVGDVVVFTVDDCNLDRTYFSNLARLWDGTEFQYGGGQVLMRDADITSNVAPLTIARRENIPPNKILAPGYIQGANMFFHRKVFQHAGSFDERLGVGEDIEMATRASMIGFRGIRLPELKVHNRGEKLTSLGRQQTVERDDLGSGAYYASLVVRGYRQPSELLAMTTSEPEKEHARRYLERVIEQAGPRGDVLGDDRVEQRSPSKGAKGTRGRANGGSAAGSITTAERFLSLAPFLQDSNSPKERRERSKDFDTRIVSMLDFSDDAALPLINCFYEVASDGARHDGLIAATSSMRACGHPVRVWSYSPEKFEFLRPSGIELRRADDVVPRAVFEKIVSGSEIRYFSDIFRYAVLYEYGGLWMDTDVFLLRPFPFRGEHFFNLQWRSGNSEHFVCGNVIYAKPFSRHLRALYELSIDRFFEAPISFGSVGPKLLSDYIAVGGGRELQDQLFSPVFFNSIDWTEVDLFDRPIGDLSDYLCDERILGLHMWTARTNVNTGGKSRSLLSMVLDPVGGFPGLAELADRFDTDKNRRTGNRHDYARIYDRILSKQRLSLRRLMEIGLRGALSDHGGAETPSVALWHSFFPFAHVTGVDQRDFAALNNERFSSFVCNQAELSQIRALAAKLEPASFDVIIDDGSHASLDQQQTLREFFPLLADGGWYFIENLDWQPPGEDSRRAPQTKSLLREIQQGRSDQTLDPQGIGDLARQFDDILFFDSHYELDRAKLLGGLVAIRKRGGSGFVR